MSERKAFEEWASKETKWDLYWSENINQYMDHQTNTAWLAWQASANRDGYKLVPVEATDLQWAAGIDAYTQAMDGQDILSASAFFDIYKAMIGATE